MSAWRNLSESMNEPLVDPPTTPALMDMGPEMFMAVVTSVSFSTKRAEYETIYGVSLLPQRFDTADLADISSGPALERFHGWEGVAIRWLWSLVENSIVHPDLLGEAVEAISSSDRARSKGETHP